MSGTLMTDVSVSSRPMTESPLTARQWVRRGELLEAASRVVDRAGGFAPTLGELGVRLPAVAAAALIGMASQVAYWKHYQSQGSPPMTVASLAQACASLFLHGAASIPSPSQEQGEPNA